MKEQCGAAARHIRRLIRAGSRLSEPPTAQSGKKCLFFFFFSQGFGVEEEISYVQCDTKKTRHSVVTFLFPECTEVSCSVKVFPDEQHCCAEENFLSFFLSFLQ